MTSLKPGSDFPEGDELLAALRSSMELVDPAPAGLDAAANRALTWDVDLDELAPTIFDSSRALAEGSDSLLPSGMRSTDAVRDLTFEHDSVSIELTFEHDDLDEVVATGVITGASDNSVVLRSPGELDRVVSLDLDGHFRAADLANRVAVRVRSAGGRFVQTPLISTRG